MIRVAIKQTPKETVKATCIPAIKISGCPGTTEVTLCPAVWLIAENNTVVANEIPTTIPRFRANELIPPAMPKSLGSTEPITSALLGAWKIPFPNPFKPIKIMKSHKGVTKLVTM